MKKLMFVAAAAASMVAVADVSSANCVGYATPEQFQEKHTMFGPMFVSVGQDTATTGEGTISVQDIKPVGEVIPDGSQTPLLTYAIEIKKLNANGGQAEAPVYWRDCTTGSGSREKTWYGWYTSDGTQPAAVTFKAGEAAWVNMPAGARCSLQTSGQVPMGDMYYALNDFGHTALCNPMPAEISVQGIKPVSADAELYPVPDGSQTPLLTYAIEIKKLNANGGQAEAPVYWRDCTTGSGSREKTWYGWYTSDGTQPAAVTFKAGEGAWVNNPAEKISFIFPAVLPVAAE